MRKKIALFVCLCLCWACAQAQTDLTPQLADPLDQAVQQLHIMSQRDEAFEGLRYNNTYLTAGGCQPVSVANAVIAVFGIQDRQTAVEVVKETADVLVIERGRGKERMELARMRQLMNAQAEEYPHLAALLQGHEMDVLDAELDAQTTCDYFAQRQSGILVGRMSVSPDWTAMLEIVQQLHDMGRDDAMLCLASVGVGKESSGAPLSLGRSGHYVTAMMHVGAFTQDGRVYVLDSLPRALAGEESGYTSVLRSVYPFAQMKAGFAEKFDAQRIRDTVIRLTPRDTDAWQSAALEQRAKMLAPLLLYGRGSLVIAVPQKNE